MSHVFISYAHVDGDFAATLIRQLSEAGIVAWVDSEQLRAGQDWRTGIDQAIEDASAVIVVVTPEAKASEYVTYEWAFALGAKTPVIPVMLKPTALHPRLEALQYLDFADFQNHPWDRLIEHLRELIGDRPGSVSIPKSAPPVVKHVAELLEHPSSDNRKAGVDSLLDLAPSPVVIDLLRVALNDPASDVRLHALERMDARGFRHTEVLPDLMDALRNQNWRFREHAQRLLIGMGAEIVPDLTQALKQADEPGHFYNEIVESLESIGTPEALAAVEQWRAQQKHNQEN